MFHLRKIPKSFAVACRLLSSSQAKPLVGITVDNEGIATLQLQRAPVNSFSLELLQTLQESICEIEKNKCKGIVLTSESPKIFSAGMDLNEFIKPDQKRLTLLYESVIDVVAKIFGTDIITTAAINRQTVRLWVRRFQETGDVKTMTMGRRTTGIYTDQSEHHPDIVKGYTGAGGCIVALAFDYRTMTTGPAIIGVNDTVVGIPPAKWIFDLMSRVMSPKHAEYALTSSFMYSAERALQVGLIDDVASDKMNAIEKCKAFIRTYDHISPAIRATTKRALRQEFLTKLEKHRPKYLTDVLNQVNSPEFQETIGRYIQSIKQKSR